MGKGDVGFVGDGGIESRGEIEGDTSLMNMRRVGSHSKSYKE